MTQRAYAKLGPTFWTGETGKALRRRGSEALVVALYLISSPHANMLGLYYQPVLYMAHETGLGTEGASKGLQHCIDTGFASYDADTEMVWVHQMAEWQIDEQLKATDKRCSGIQKAYEALPENPFLGPWFDRYARAFHLKRRRSSEGEQQEADSHKKEAPSKPHRSQEQEQEQDPPSGERGEGASPADEKASPRPSRKCPKSFELTPELVQWARVNAPGVSIQRETEKFRDHTFGVAKSDWPATWRNWMRTAAERAGGRNGSHSGDIFEAAL